jgi:hypothetical protein
MSPEVSKKRRDWEFDGLFKAGLGETSGLVEESEANLKFISRGRYLERRGITIGRRGEGINERLRASSAWESCSGEGDWWWSWSAKLPASPTGVHH